MEWDDEAESEYVELFADWAQIAPGLERSATFEDRLDAIERRLEVLEGRNPLLEQVKGKLGMKGE